MDFEEILKEAEEQQILQRKRIYTSMLNQPAFVGVNSTDRVITTSQDSFSSFQINLPRPALEVDAIQLVNANIPQCNPNIPDTACVFWYYRLSGYSGSVPNPDNLFMVRLLPTTYNPEYISQPQLYGFNKTFADYPALASELALACANDLGYYNSFAYDGLFTPDRNYVVPFLPNEVSITYNSGLNKFQFTGTNATTRFAYKEYNSFNTYDEGDVVFVDAGGGSAFNTYQSLQNANTGNAVTNTTWWKRVYVDVVREWDATTPYPVGRYVAYLEDLYVCIQNSTGDDPFTSPAYWLKITESGEVNYRYLSAGFGDPNVALLQSKGNRQWNTYTLYETNAVVEFDGSYWSATFQNQGQEPFDFTSSTAWNGATQYRKGDVVSNGGLYYKAAQDSLNQTPTPYSATYWILQCWTPTATLPDVVGLYEVTSAVDMVETTPGGATLIPFPVGVAGQPFVKTPKRILNTILGFTWNGVMYTALLQNIPSISFVSVISGANTDLYNRLRPIPPYITSTTVGLGAIESTSTSTQTYTADGYCNLVYSSIINIYCSVVYGSTLDTTRNTNLIAIGTMNCGNLGISYFSPIITNPLRIRGDVYALEFQFFDECGDPYVFTNNAVVTLGLKIDYKKLPDEKVM